MRRWICTILICLSLFGMCFGVQALTGITTQNSFTTVASDGSCQVSITATVHLDQAMEDLAFPVPKEATAVTLNGSWVRTKSQATRKLVPISGKMAGDFSFTIAYSLPNMVKANEAGLLELRLPLLCGFAYPTASFEFSVTLPGAITNQPSFSSGYHQATIEEDLSFVVDGAIITGRTQKALKDHETLEMILQVSEVMFPQTVQIAPSLEVTNLCATVCAVLALVYWLVFLRALPPRSPKQAVLSEGASAGQMPCLLFLRGADLTMMVFSWAQLGYIRIQRMHNGRILLHKYMEMGNERDSFERRCFGWLFAKRETVDTSSQFYGMLCQKVESMGAAQQGLTTGRAVNAKIFRILAALIGLFGGVGLATMLADGAALVWLMALLLGLLGAYSSYRIQMWFPALFSYQKRPLWMALGLCAVWLILGAVAQQFQMSLWVVLSQLLAGFLVSFGGRRTQAGRQAMAQGFGLWRYLRTVSRQQMQQRLENNPEYFHDMAPYALALGVDRRFAKRADSQKQTESPYLVMDRELFMSAQQWDELYRQIIQQMNVRRSLMPLERLKKIIRAFLP